MSENKSRRARRNAFRSAGQRGAAASDDNNGDNGDNGNNSRYRSRSRSRSRNRARTRNRNIGNSNSNRNANGNIGRSSRARNLLGSFPAERGMQPRLARSQTFVFPDDEEEEEEQLQEQVQGEGVQGEHANAGNQGGEPEEDEEMGYVPPSPFYEPASPIQAPSPVYEPASPIQAPSPVYEPASPIQQTPSPAYGPVAQQDVPMEQDVAYLPPPLQPLQARFRQVQQGLELQPEQAQPGDLITRAEFMQLVHRIMLLEQRLNALAQQR